MTSKDEIICPHCKKEYNHQAAIGTSGLLNYGGGEGNITCKRCGKDFYYTFEVTIKFRTRKKY